ncbi:MAG: type I-B CRISPR-associated protein Cas7/Csh2 [Melioribacteraceae bacterium]|nr:type I-B CRISPR-associated protein Cas7/Csh2 [Melioribacteraceae bacterium]MCF8396205.1 type I-B CRISPR-associated protein Cas7/Csh2 [Melioribacteraceae bacterium]
MENSIVQNKSEILFLYESTYTIPNGDPFTGEQRYDEETKKILVSDVRIKRYIRDYLLEQKEEDGSSLFEIYVWNDIAEAAGKESGSAARMKSLKKKYEKDESLKSRKDEKTIDATKLLQKCIDVRLFGGISTEEKDSVNLTGPIQFALLNPSLNKVELRMHQNTSVFVSSVEKTRGAIGTTSVVPYAVNQIHGWINPYSAKYTNLSDVDVSIMFKALWESVNNANTRTKANQNSLLLLQIIYSDTNNKLYGLDRLIKLDTKVNGEEEKKDEQLRSIDDYKFDLSKLEEIAGDKRVKEILYYTEVQKIKDAIEIQSKEENSKFKELKLSEIKYGDEAKQ